MYDWILHRLADRLGAAPAQPGEEATPRLVFEQPWSQTLFVFTALLSVALICWLYQREGKASTASKVVLAAIRIATRIPGDVHAVRGGALRRPDRVALSGDPDR